MHRTASVKGEPQTWFRRGDLPHSYSVSKLVQVLMTYRLQAALNSNEIDKTRNTASASDITVHCCNPGAVATGIWRHDGCAFQEHSPVIFAPLTCNAPLVH